MGNCCKTASSMEWGGEDWSFLTSKEKNNHNHNNKKRSSRKVFDELKLNKEKLVVGDVISASSDDDGNGKIKIKITKRELEVLLGEIEKQKQKQKRQGKVLSAEQVIVRLMKASRENHHRAWSPVLEGIPEVNSD